MSLNCIFYDVEKKTLEEIKKLAQEVNADRFKARREGRKSEFFLQSEKGAHLSDWQDPIVYVMHKNKRKMTKLQIRDCLIDLEPRYYGELTEPEMHKGLASALNALRKCGRVAFTPSNKILREQEAYWLVNPDDKPSEKYLERLKRLAALTN